MIVLKFNDNNETMDVFDTAKEFKAEVLNYLIKLYNTMAEAGEVETNGADNPGLNYYQNTPFSEQLLEYCNANDVRVEYY